MAKIYISSTFGDLKEERFVAEQTVRELDHTPVLMEDYAISSLSPLQKCLEEVGQCDVFVGIYAWRYGYIPRGQEKSIIHLEYEEARNRDIPCLIFLQDGYVLWPQEFISSGETRKKIDALRAQLYEEQLISRFENLEQLEQMLINAISSLDISEDSLKLEKLNSFPPELSLINPIFLWLTVIFLALWYILSAIIWLDSQNGNSSLIEDPPYYTFPEVKRVSEMGYPLFKNSYEFWEASLGYVNSSIYIPMGKFLIGAAEFTDQKPIHYVDLDCYWIGKTEVTVGSYMKFVDETGSHYPIWREQGNEFNIETGNNALYRNMGRNLTNPSNPIVGISWDDAIAYCRWLSGKTGFYVTLPTEAQWEKAARGTGAYMYPWGNGNVSGMRANIADEAFSKEFSSLWVDKSINDGYTYTAPVGSFPGGASPCGALDMAGNVWEWCLDWYASGYDETSNVNPKGPEKGEYRVMRGGSWSYYNGRCNCAYRNCERPSRRAPDIGFRIVINPRKTGDN